jgi:hypothetical protein
VSADRLALPSVAALQAALTAIGGELATITLITYELAEPHATTLRRRLRCQLLNALDVALAAPPVPPQEAHEPL